MPGSDSEVMVRGSAIGLAQEITAGSHRLYADEPKKAGGEDTGPSPYQLIAAALGACTSMTLEMYARKKQWPLRSVVVKVRHSKAHAEDCDSCEKNDSMLDQMERDIELVGELSEEQRTKLLDIADSCPVHKTLARGMRVVSHLA